MKTPVIANPAMTVPALAALVLLAGCASFSADGGRQTVDALTQARIGMPMSAAASAPTSSATSPTSSTSSTSSSSSSSATAAAADAPTSATEDERRRLLAAPLSADDAVRLALLNNPRVKIALAELGIAEADLVQAGRLRNPRIGFGRLSGDDGVEIERSVMFDLAGLLTLPMRRAVEQRRFEQAQLQAALQTVRLAAETRRAYFHAVAASQSLSYLQQAALASEASAELAQRMAKAGNFSKLDEAREQAFHAEVSAQLKRAEHGVQAARERLSRLLGLSTMQVLRLPERLPELPPSLATMADVETVALSQRLDVQVARVDTEATAKNLGLTRSTRFVNVLELGYQDKHDSGGARADGYEVELSLPVFDSGDARLRRAEAIYQRSLLRTAEIAVLARSEAREGYALLRSQYQVARQYRDEIVPARKRISDEVLLRYNGMLASVFELLTDARAQIAGVTAAIDAQRDFWIAEADLQFTLHGGSPSGAALGSGAFGTSGMSSRTFSTQPAAAAGAH